MTSTPRYTDDQLEEAIHAAVKAHDIGAVPVLLAEMARQNPQRADAIRTVILAGLAIAKERHEREAS